MTSDDTKQPNSLATGAAGDRVGPKPAESDSSEREDLSDESSDNLPSDRSEHTASYGAAYERDPSSRVTTETETQTLAEPPGLEDLLTYLHEARGFDFSGYKRGGLQRRLGKRLSALNIETYSEYVDYLQVHPHEFGNLFNSILINATGFFRDPMAWEYVAHQVVPRLLAAKQPSATIRVWCAGCATGQEAYTVAMMLAEALGLESFSRRVKIYATDIDDDALNQARQATYGAKDIIGIPVELLDRYFERNGAKYAFQKDLRRSVIFGRHNLVYDAPISKIDLLVCRNTLMYFNAKSQARILSSLHFALNDAGVLFLGKAEMLLTHNALFTPLELKRRLFSKVTHAYPRPRAGNGLILGAQGDDAPTLPAAQARMREAAFEAAPVPQIGFDARGVLCIVNEPARRMLGIGPVDLGKTLAELTLTRKIENLRTAVDQANADRRPVQLVSAEWLRLAEEPLYFDIVVAPILEADGRMLGIHVSFLDVTTSRSLQEELQQATQELEGAYEELQSTSEELETTNEELQSTVEELETTNEELQSTNEELETTNEELQSTNEELQSMNEELRTRTSDLARVNVHFESILASMRSAVVVIDLEFHTQVWSSRAQDLWGLRADEVQGKHFLNLDIGLPVEKLSGAVRACMAGDDQFNEVTLIATNRRGRPIAITVMLSRLTQDGQAAGAILLMDERELSRPETAPDPA